jgi:outer membrane immunogenic protein
MRLLLVTLLSLTAIDAACATDRDWNGFYAGGSLGYGESRTKADFALPAGAAFSTDTKLSGGLFGGQAGYNFHRGALLLGVEADAAFSTQKSQSLQTCAAPTCGVADLSFANEQKVTWIGTVRGRLGFTFDRWLVYGTGGVGAGGFKSQYSVSTTLSRVTHVETYDKVAWVAGGGVEVALDPRWSVKAEYLYFALPDMRSTYALAGVGAITETDNMAQHIIRAGINYRF